MFFAKKDKGVEGGSRVEHLEKQVQKNPGSFHLRIKLAEAYIQEGEREKGLALLMEMASKDAREGSVDKAIAVYKLVLRYDPDHLEARDILATIYRCKGLTAEADALAADEEDQPEEEAEDFDLLPRIGSEDLRRFAEIFPVEEVPAGTVVVHQGEVSDSFYLIM
ncbi:MAG: tetratricopeptide repeat protein, partial [Deltaproteobacteria bacterium]|nr:tetratricopeptide repeat protein [Deltaproteobacteria bacterium]